MNSPRSSQGCVLSHDSKHRTKGQTVIVPSLYYHAALRPLYLMCHISVANEIRWTSISFNMKSMKMKCVSISVCVAYI